MIENVDPATLNAHPDNPRRGNIDAIAESIRTNGWWGVIVAQTSTRRVLAGNHRLEAAKRLNMTSVPVHWLDVDDHAARRILLADNRAADLAAYDDATLAALLDTITLDTTDLDGTLYTRDDADRLLASIAGPIDPTREWEGMPEYDQNDENSTARVTIHFATHDDADAFFALIERPRRTSMWWPADDGKKRSDTSLTYVADA